MSQFTYLAGLAVSLGALALIDRRWRLALFDQPRRAALTVAATVVFFLLWDLIGVGLGIFFVGDSPYLTGWHVAPEVPIEELAFLTLLGYQTLLLWRAFDRRTGSTGAASGPAVSPGGAA
ncbi:lycopene cyclase domain-containing protein [Demequina pelophila]|uniref:lycopene cyclase domain-containing protein n=1 Tax=Demequina pelophila TaxID=1638984 RepID=UPI000781250E|nr:lycopene cyclase domain-containing protein [Demequina pelophila]